MPVSRSRHDSRVPLHALGLLPLLGPLMFALRPTVFWGSASIILIAAALIDTGLRFRRQDAPDENTSIKTHRPRYTPVILLALAGALLGYVILVHWLPWPRPLLTLLQPERARWAKRLTPTAFWIRPSLNLHATRRFLILVTAAASAAILGYRHVANFRSKRILARYVAFGGLLGIPATIWLERVHPQISNSPRLEGTFGGANAFASWQAIIWFVGLGLILSGVSALFSDKFRTRAARNGYFFDISIGSVTVIATLWLLFKSGSRFATISWGITIALLLFLWLSRYTRTRAINWRHAPVLILGIIVLTMLLLPHVLAERFRSLASAISENKIPRIPIWLDSQKLWLAFPFFGAGPGGYRYAFPHFQSIDLQYLYTNPHQEPLAVLCDMGIFGAVLAGVMAWLLVRHLYDLRRMPSRTEFSLTACIAVGIVLPLIHSMADFPLRLPAIALSCALMFGAILNVLQAEADDSRRIAPARHVERLRAFWRFVQERRAVTIAMFRVMPALLALFVMGLAAQAVFADPALPIFPTPSQYAAHFHDQSRRIARLQRAIAHDRLDASAAAELARYYFDRGVNTTGDAKTQGRVWFQRALNIVETALLDTPAQPELWYRKGCCEYRLGINADAKASLTNQLWLTPTYSSLTFGSGKLLLQHDGNDPDSFRIALNGFRLAVRQNPRLSGKVVDSLIYNRVPSWQWDTVFTNSVPSRIAYARQLVARNLSGRAATMLLRSRSEPSDNFIKNDIIQSSRESRLDAFRLVLALSLKHGRVSLAMDVLRLLWTYSRFRLNAVLRSEERAFARTPVNAVITIIDSIPGADVQAPERLWIKAQALRRSGDPESAIPLFEAYHDKIADIRSARVLVPWALSQRMPRHALDILSQTMKNTPDMTPAETYFIRSTRVKALIMMKEWGMAQREMDTLQSIVRANPAWSAHRAELDRLERIILTAAP